MAKAKLMSTVTKAAGLTGGAVAAKFATRLVPIGNEKVKSFIPILLGVFLVNRPGIVGDLGAGMIAAGGSDLVSSFGIGATEPVLAGMEEQFISENVLAGTSENPGGEFESEYQS
jgi:hypothetical protein